MAPSAEPYISSYLALSALHRTLRKHSSLPINHALPERPRNLSVERDLFLDGAISTLSASTNYVLDSVLEIKDDMKDVKSQVDRLETRFIRLEGEVNEVKKVVHEVKRETDRRFKGLEGRFANMGAQEPWDDIVPVEYNNQAGDHTVNDGFPRDHPDKVVKLWRLQTPRHRRALVSLLEFYDICGWQSWGYEDRLVPDSDSESDDIGEKNPTLAAAVASHPKMALRALTQRLGVNYERMKERMLKWEVDQRRRVEEMKIEKRKSRGLGRKPAGDSSIMAPAKFRKTDAEITSPEGLPTRLPLKDLVGRSKSVESRLSPVSGTKLDWKVGSSSGEHPVVRDTYYKARSEGSTVPNTEDETEMRGLDRNGSS
ncbi:hypothetical protein K469DRAFT_711769 [Zopfia rhizophila CBS 207.26]|uniref:Uncharacterized protein n=1 Tax=Zopfia rhizophila CBS 207.26 TaxID=1314779 RepID=A0A6A6DW59_9PEZI|nr:hypothetical protein K469DRAFT_711769 [Zopfia rhizophila CBS 207.26]